MEQTDPNFCYSTLADDSIRQLEYYVPLDGRSVVDVGGGPGFFANAFRAAGASYAAVDPDAGELSLHGRTPPRGTLRASGLDLPFADNSFDVSYSSNVLEHVPDPWRMADEMIRVIRPGGVSFISYTVWLGPHGGHETSKWHYLGGDFARKRYEKVHGHPPKNYFGKGLFAVSAADGVKWARQTPNADLIEAFPRYHPWWASSVVKIPVVREFLTWNLVLVLRKR